jgi:type IV secretory pathway TraG/TraD family ATPase VirD4
MAAMTKKDGARMVLDAHASSQRLRIKLNVTIVGGLLIALLIAMFSQWQFGVAAALLFGLLIQFSHERMKTMIEAKTIQGFQVMNWDQSSEMSEDNLKKIRALLDK